MIAPAPPPPPSGIALLHQRWSRLVFLHWPVDPDRVRPLLPTSVTLDLHEGLAWLSVSPFVVSRMRPAFLPALPLLSQSLEINVRTYVRDGEAPAVFFFSMDASNPLAVWGARIGFGLPYFQARMTIEDGGDTVCFRSERAHPGATAASLDATWSVGAERAPAKPGSLDYFLTERYVLYGSHRGRVVRGRIHHARWTLREARLSQWRSTMLAASGLPEPVDPPLLHAQGAPLDVRAWNTRRV